MRIPCVAQAGQQMHTTPARRFGATCQQYQTVLYFIVYRYSVISVAFDQRLSKSEAANDKSLARTFAYLDADGNGYLTLREYTAHLKK